MAVRQGVTRRAVFALASAAVTAVIVAPAIIRPAEAARRPLEMRSLMLDNLHTGERLNTVYWADGHYVPEALRRINWVLRDHHSDEVHEIEPPLIELLARLHQRLATREPFQVLSGYRSPATNAMLAATTEGVAGNSLHIQGMAVDLRVPGRALVKVHRAAMMMQAGGVGYYPRSDFVHVDAGRVRYW
ncbi:MAG: hypothetical protein JWL84_612 [Rhodospirillales bacterium]|jgi:uncharacterized protein YcbK (DUF882 family)|nr:hypothetical protein [Rhodospirillales bacterium]